MTRTGVGDAVVSTQVLLRGRHLRANPVARHAVRVICLVHDASGAAGAQDVAARFWAKTKRRRGRGEKGRWSINVFFCGSRRGRVVCGSPLTLALPLVLHVQVWVAFAFRLQQRALVFVGLAVRAADGSLPGDVGAVWRAHAARLAPPVHLAPFPRTTVDVVAGFYNTKIICLFLFVFLFCLFFSKRA